MPRKKGAEPKLYIFRGRLPEEDIAHQRALDILASDDNFRFHKTDTDLVRIFTAGRLLIASTLAGGLAERAPDSPFSEDIEQFRLRPRAVARRIFRLFATGQMFYSG